MSTLHIVIGRWASGKTTLANELRSRSSWVVFDWDLIIPGLSTVSGHDVHTDPTTWRGLKETWQAVLGAVLAAGHDVLLCGPMGPDDLSFAPPLDVAKRCAYLDCSDETLRTRLCERGASETEVEDELAMAATLRQSGWHRVAAGDRAPSDVAEEVAAWVARGS